MIFNIIRFINSLSCDVFVLMMFSAFLVKELRKTTPILFTALIFSFFINILMLSSPLYTMQVLDRVLSSGSSETLLMLTIVVVGALLFIGLLQGLRSLIFSQLGCWLDETLSPDIVRKTLEFSLYKPVIGNQPLRDLTTLKNFVSSPALATIFDAPWAPLYFVVIFMINKWLGLMVLFGAILLLGLALLAKKIPNKQQTKANEKQVRSMQAFDAMLRNAEVVKAMGLRCAVSNRWRQHHEESLAHTLSASNSTTVIGGVTRTFRLGLQIVLTGVGAWLALAGEMSAGSIIAVSILSGKALAPFDAAVNIYQSWSGVRVALNRLADLDDAVPEEISVTRLPEPNGEVRIENLAYRLPENGRWVIRGLDINIEAGEVIGVIGPSGTGKTTLARILVGVLLPTNGVVRLDGATLQHWPSEQLGNHIGYLPQDVELFSGTVADNIARLSPEAKDEDVVAAAQLASVHQFILQLPQAYQTDIGPNGAFLSAGQRQRIALARCFFGDPKLVVLDEPNSNLDSEGEAALVQCLLNAKRRGVTTVTVTHRPSVLQCADKILVLHEGEAKLFGPTAEVMKKLSVGQQIPSTRTATA